MQKPWAKPEFALCLWKMSTLNSFTWWFERTSRMFTGVSSSLPVTSASKLIGGRAHSLGHKTSRHTASCKQLLFRTVCSQRSLIAGGVQPGNGVCLPRWRHYWPERTLWNFLIQGILRWNSLSNSTSDPSLTPGIILLKSSTDLFAPYIN